MRWSRPSSSSARSATINADRSASGWRNNPDVVSRDAIHVPTIARYADPVKDASRTGTTYSTPMSMPGALVKSATSTPAVNRMAAASNGGRIWGLRGAVSGVCSMWRDSCKQM